MDNFFIRGSQKEKVNCEVDLVDLFFGNEKKYIGKYQGSILNYSPHGAGNLIFANGDEYFGQFNNGIIEGKGVLTESSGNKYEGSFHEGKKHGNGKMTYSNHDKFEGEWVDDLRCGHGFLYYSSGDEFEGEWFNDLRHGIGRLNKKDGDVFEGEWCENNWYNKGKRDPLFEEAAKLIVFHQQGSTSLIQRKLNLSYSRAGKIIDQLEAAGVIGPFEGSKARDVLIPNEASLKVLLDEGAATQTETKQNKDEAIKKILSCIGNWKWENHPGHIISIEADSSREKFYKGICIKIGVEKFYTSKQVMLDNIELCKDSIIKGIVLVPFGAGKDPGFTQRWFDFVGHMNDNSFNIIIGTSKWSWTFSKISK